MIKMMKKAFFMGEEKFEFCDVPIPTPGPGELLIRNAVCGICGTDIHIFHGEPGSADVVPPVVLGHEYSGIVQQVGENVTDFKVGDHVTIDPNIYCGKCCFCRKGKKQLCEDMQAIGVTRDGGFEEYSVIPASQAFLLNPDLDLEVGAMAEPLACCIHGIDLAQIHTGDTVLVIGGGAIGLLMVQLAKMAGAAKVILSEPVKFRRDLGEKLGADYSIDPTKSNPAEQIRYFTGKNGADVVIECVGKVSATKQAFETASKGATLLLFSVPSIKATYELPMYDIFKKELVIKGSFVNPDTHSRAVELLNSGKIQVMPLFTHRYKLEDLPEAIQMQSSSESIKVLVCLA